VNIAEATLSEGGGTFDARTLEQVTRTSGYAVAVAGIERDARRFPAALIVPAARMVVDRYGGDLVGTWTEGDVLYIDSVVVIEDRAIALDLAREHGQLGVWDFANERTVYLGEL
jgi:hypothetical protein